MTPEEPPALRIFGGVVVCGAQGEVELGGPKQRAVLALLVVEPQVVVSVDRIIDMIWGDRPPARAEVSVRGYVSNLRKPLAGTLGDAAAIDFRDRGYVLLADPATIDLHRFEQWVRDGSELVQAGDLTEARRTLVAALELSSGRPFGALADQLRLDDVVARIEQGRAEAAELLSQVRLDLGEHDTIVPELLRFVSLYPYRERLRVQLATALYRSGDQVAALRCIDDGRRMLVADVGVDPGPELRDVEAMILAHDPALLWTPLPPAKSSPPPAAVGRVRQDLFGRDQEMAMITAPVHRLPVGGAVVIGGEAGIGKTAVLRSLAEQATAADVVVGWGRCPESATDAPYRPWTMAAHQLASQGGPTGLVSAQSEAGGAPAEDRSAARLLTQLAVADAIRESPAPMLVVIDDLQWADDATLGLVEFLASELDSLPLVLAVSVRRAGRGDLRQAVRNCLAELARVDGVAQVTLRGLDETSVREWLRSVLHGEPPPGLEGMLTSSTDGNPFYVRELIALLQSEGRLDSDPSDRRVTPVPPVVHDVVRRRTSRLPPETQQLLATAAVIGRRFDLDILAEVSESDPVPLLETLEPALGSGLVEIDDDVAGRCSFSHALVAETLVAEQSPSRRAQLHARITLAMEALPADRVIASLEDLAHHAVEGATAGTGRQAFDYSLRAADASRGARASGDEVGHLRRALAVQPTTDPDRDAVRVQLLTRLGVALRDSGDVAGGRDALIDAALAAETSGDTAAVASALAGLSNIDLWAAIDWSTSDPRATALIERVLASEPTGPAPATTALRADLAAELVYVDPTRAATLSGAALADAEQIGDPALLQRVLLQRLWAVSAPSAVDERAAIAQRLVGLAESGALPASFTPLAHLSTVSAALERGQIDAVEAAVAAARQTADPGRTPRAWMHLLWTEVSLSMLRGDLDRALVEAEMLRRAAWRVRRFTAESSYAAAASAVLAEQGRIDDALRTAAVLNQPPYDTSAQWFVAWLLASCGRPDDAAAALSRWDGPVPGDWLTLVVLTAGVLTASALEDRGFLRRHLPALEPLAGRLAVMGTGGPFLGPVDHALASAKRVLGDVEGARRHAAAAHRQASDIGAVLWNPRVEAITTLLGSSPDDAVGGSTPG